MSNEMTVRMALAKYKFEFTHSLGQNFLLNDKIIADIVRASGIEAGDRVLEIGAGAGILTLALAKHGCKVTALELDTRLEPVLRDVLSGLDDNVRLAFGDIMKTDVRELMGAGRYSVVANLPYYITADVILKLIAERSIKSTTVMVQQEAADRIMSAPGTKSWCALAATVQYYSRPEVLMQVPPEAFTPRPHVMSCVMRIVPHEGLEPVKGIVDMIQCAFAMRRKTLVNNLMAHYSMARDQAVSLVKTIGLDEKVRGEALSVAQLAQLAEKYQIQ